MYIVSLRYELLRRKGGCHSRLEGKVPEYLQGELWQNAAVPPEVFNLRLNTSSVCRETLEISS